MSRRRAPRRALAAGAAIGLTAAAAQFSPLPFGSFAVAGASQATGIPVATSDDLIIPAGQAAALGAPGDEVAALVGLAATPTGAGYWALADSGRVYGFGDGHDFGVSVPTTHLLVDIAGTPSGQGYWVAAADGGVFTAGDAGFLGSLGSVALNSPVTAMAATSSGNGYWLVAADGGVFTFGDAEFLGSLGSVALNSPVTAMAATPSGNGYWLVAADGGVFTFGDAEFLGSLGSVVLNSPVAAMAATPSGNGYWMVGGDGGIFAFGDAPVHGRFWADGHVTDLAVRPDGQGYWAAVAEHHANRQLLLGSATGALPGEPGDEVFDRLAQCESGGNWGISTGNGYYGGLQFSLGTWRANGGAGYPHQHPREVQIEVARRQWRATGWRAWPLCGRSL